MNRFRRVALTFVFVLAGLAATAHGAAAADDDQKTPARPAAAPAKVRKPSPVQIRAFAGLDDEKFAASKTFDAIFQTNSIAMPAFGASVLLPWAHLFTDVTISHFRKTGQRAFVDNGTVYRLGISDTLTMTPVLATAGIRVPRGRIAPYVGGGVGWYSVKEESAFAQAGDNVSQTTIGYHVLGGVEYRVWSRIAVAGEARYASVPNALGDAGLAHDLNESDLGGFTVGARVIVTLLK